MLVKGVWRVITMSPERIICPLKLQVKVLHSDWHTDVAWEEEIVFGLFASYLINPFLTFVLTQLKRSLFFSCFSHAYFYFLSSCSVFFCPPCPLLHMNGTWRMKVVQNHQDFSNMDFNLSTTKGPDVEVFRSWPRWVMQQFVW